MKIQKLVIHNIASIEDATIDFSATPLVDSDVFLITGETGSGKSTILDAICLALYKSTPRLENTRMQGAVADAGKDVQISDPVQLLRENTGEGFVNLTFEGSNGIPYEAEWSVARARNKPTGRLQGKKWTLKDLHSGTTYTKDAEIEAEISRAVKLTFEQFCRTTMLAQGEFTRFLNSKDEEKAEILEMITGADIYSKIGAKVYEITQRKEKDYDAAKKAVEGIVLLTQQQREEKTQAIAELNKQVQSAIISRAQYKAKAEWLETEADLSVRIGKAGEALTEAESAASSEEFLQEKALVASWRQTQEVRRELENEAAENRKAQDARKAIALKADGYQRVHAGVRFLRGRERAIEGELTEVNAFLEKEKADLPVIEKAQAVDGQLAIINSGYQTISGWDVEIQEADNQLTETLVPGKTLAEKALADAKAAKTQTWKTLQAAEAALSRAGLPAIRAEIMGLTTEKGNVQLAHDRIGNHVLAWQAYNKEGEAILAAEQELSKKKTFRETLAKEVDELGKKAAQARMTYDTESMAMSNAVTTIRSRLTVGCVCPVCMQEIKSALPTDKEIAERLRPLWEASEAARLNHEAAKQRLDTLDATISAESGQLEQRKASHAADTTVSAWNNAVKAALQSCGVQTYDAGTDPWLVERLGAIDARLSELSAIEQQGQGLEKAAQDARTADGNVAKALEQAQEAFRQAEKKVTEATAELNKTKALKEARKKDVIAAVDMVKAIVKGTRWEDGWHERREAFQQELSDAVAAHAGAIQKRDALTQEKKEVSDKADAVGRILAEVLKMVPDWESLALFPPEELDNILETAQTLKDDLLIERQNENNAMAASLRAASNVHAFLDINVGYDRNVLAKLSEYPADVIGEHEANQKEVGDALVAAKASVATLKNQVQEHAAKQPEFEEGDTLESLKEKEKACDDDVVKYSGEASVLDQELKADAVNAEKVGDLAAKAESLREVWVKWDRLNDLVGDNTGKKFRKIAQSYVLGSLVTAANHYMHELTDRYALKVVPGTFIISVEDAYQGFASRPASTISGGESFLVSLSLALALSDIGDSLSVDTLFIDEGFGTLSGAPLQNAVNTLKSLRTKAGRHVGIISHIEELQEKIPVRIQVEKSGKTSSSSVTVVPEE